jgi:Flp pilus assembly protein TadG
MKKTWKTFCRSLQAFRVARGANVAITFAFASVPVIGAIGAGYDYSHANAVKAEMQAALDSTALMLAKDAASLSNGDLQVKAKAYFTSLFTRPEAKLKTIGASYSTEDGSAVKVDGSVDVPTTFIKALNLLKVSALDNITVNGTSTAKWGNTLLRVALVLDNTGSMSSDGKMTALKTATKNMLTQLKTASAKDGDVYVSIIPFAKDVNVGAANYKEKWIDWRDWETKNGTCTKYSGQNEPTSESSCDAQDGKWKAAKHKTWTGCIMDRDQNYDQNVTAADPNDKNLIPQIVGAVLGGQASTLFPAEQYSACPVAMMGLNYDWTAMNSLVDSMQPSGATNQPIGLVWGWQSLVGGGPLTAPDKIKNNTYQEAIVLMSDGLNTQDRWYGNGSNMSTAVDKRMYDPANGNGTCANIKAAGITIYTIHVNTGGDPMSTLLKNCASSADKFFHLTNANDLIAVFNNIGTNLSKLRVAK